MLKDEKGRQKALKTYHIIDTVNEPTFDRITKLASLICGVPICLISLIDENRQWFKSRVGLNVSETARELAFCNHAILDEQIFEVPDAKLDERFRESPLVTGEPDIRFYAGRPLVDPDGHPLGTLCVIDRVPRELSEVQREVLGLLAQETMELILDRRKKEEYKHFEMLFRLSNDLLCIAGTDGFFKKVNPAFQKILGWDQASLLSTSFFSMIHPEDASATQREIERLAAGEQTINFIHRFKRKDNSYRWLQWVATPEKETGLLFAIARDITDEKEREAARLETEQRFRSFFESSQGLMCTHDLDGNIQTVNAAGASLMGYRVDEIIGRNLADLIAPAFRSSLKGYMDSILDTGKASGLMHIQHKDGTVLIWLYNNVLELVGTKDAYVIGNAIDITGRQKLEDELKRTSEKLERTNEIARIGTWEMDLAYQTMYWSPVTKAIHGVPTEYLPEYEKAISFYQGDNRKIIVDAVNHAVENNVPYDVEVQITNMNGDQVWVRAVGQPEFTEGSCTRLYGTFQDIDLKKKAEQALLNEKLRLAAFVEHTPSAVAMMDIEFRYIAVSERWRENYGIREDVIGRSQFEIYPDLSERWRKICDDALKGQGNKGDEDRWRPEGFDHDLFLRWEILPWYQYDGSIGGIMVFTEDVTASRMQMEELEQAKLHAEQASIAKSEFLANMSHEIRTPLNGVIGFTDLVLKTALSETQRQYVTIINQSGNALLAIINDILDFSKIEAGRLELDVEKCDLYELCGQASDIITYQVQHKGLEMLLNIGIDLPRFIYADAVRLKQILVNLLGNASKFTEKGEIELKIDDLGGTVDERKIRFSVRDTGIGIKTERQSKIFEAFTQEDGSTTKRFGGTGLGLTISNKLLSLMNSRLQLESTPGEGSTFYFDIQFPTEPGEPIEWTGLENVRDVLVVDDNAHNRTILNQMLALRQIKVTEAENGFDALQLLAKGNRYDVILMDYHMPFMNGLETAKKIRENFFPTYNEQPIALLHSSSDDQRILLQCKELDIYKRMIKPIKLQDIYTLLSRLHISEQSPDQREQLPSFSGSINSCILVADDNPVNMLLTRTIIKSIVPHVELVEVTNGAEAVAFCKRRQPDLILMDVQMPLMNGYDATRQIRQINNGNGVPIIALTAGNVKGEKEKCLAAGMDDFVVKPIVVETLALVFGKWFKDESTLQREPSQTDDINDVHYDPAKLKSYFGNDSGILNEALKIIKKELLSAKYSISAACEVQDTAAANALGHKLYGTATSAGMWKLAELASRLEHLDQNGKTNIQELGTALNQEINIILTLISS